MTVEELYERLGAIMGDRDSSVTRQTRVSAKDFEWGDCDIADVCQEVVDNELVVQLILK